MTNRGRLAIGAVLAGAVLLAGCGAGTAPTEPPSLEGTTWRVVEIAGQATLGANPPAMTFGSGRIRGDTGCNTFSAAVTVEPGIIDVAGINSTLRLCDGQVGQIETSFMRALVSARTLSFDAEGDLIIGGDGGDIHFVAAR